MPRVIYIVNDKAEIWMSKPMLLSTKISTVPLVTYGVTSLCGEIVGLRAWSSNEHAKTMTIPAQGTHVSQAAFSYAIVNATGAKTASISSVPGGT